MTFALDIENLHVEFSTRNGIVKAVRGVSVSLQPGGTLGIVGESGSGKSVTAFAVTRLLDRSGSITEGKVVFQGKDLVGASEREMRRLRGASLSMIFQNPRAALNPIRSVESQLTDALDAHQKLTAQDRRARALELLQSVKLSDPERVMASYPHELSGGMCQRVMIALAVACNPDILIADEPTTGLDVTTQKAVMDLLAKLAAEREMAVILITHDLGLAAQYCQNVAVMQNGEIVETAAPDILFRSPTHPYTKRLIAASPTAHSNVRELIGEAPDCRPVLRGPRQKRKLLEVTGLVKRYKNFAAVDDVSFNLEAGESIGLVGESGSGKSTISRIICRLIDKTEGEVLFEGDNIGDVPASHFYFNPVRDQIQIVFQDPHGSLNPRYTAFDCIAHPLRRLSKIRDGKALRARVEECAERVGLDTSLLSRFPHQLSGGQKSRVGIARAIATRPKLLILDEPTAALDVSVQAIVLNLLDQLRREEGLSFFFVSHDLNVVRMMCDKVVVLKDGKVVEEGDGSSLFIHPKTDYTRALLEAVPHFEPHKMTA